MKFTIENGFLMIRIKLEKPRLSTTGKSMVIASSRGPKPCGSMVKGHTIYVVVSAFYYPDGANASEE